MMPADFWGGWVLLATVASLLGLGWFVWSVYFGNGGSAGDRNEAAPVWDGTLREGSQPAPMWWFWLLLASLVFTVIYLMLYPGLGSFAGALQWSQGGRLAASEAAWEARFGAARAAVAAAPLAALQADDGSMATAEGIYARHCAACHGPDAQGQARLFPNLRDAEWQWGGSAADIERTIRRGRQAVMVGWGAALGADGVAAVADYVLRLPSGVPAEHPGEARYRQFCVACHGVLGEGQALLGAPSLADGTYLYGGDRAALEASIRDGRNGEMPAFEERLDAAQIRLLVAWLLRRGDAADARDS